jgi:hypothetical protein
VSVRGAAELRAFTDFFPAGAFGRGDSGMDAFIANWYATHLRAFKEPSLRSPPKEQQELYRFTMLPTFHHPLSVRLVVAPDGSATAVAKRLTGKGGYEPGHLDFERTHPVTRKQVEQLRRSLASRAFWDLPTELPRTATDGTEWIFEAFRGGRYHVVTRHSPEDVDPYRELCLQLLGLGQLKEIDAYLSERPKSK